jgi:hypothetical protein
VQQRGHQRDPAATAHQEDAAHPAGGQAGGPDRGPGRGDGRVEDRAGELLELVTAERRVLVGQRNVDHGGRGPRQHLLRRPHVFPQQPVGPPVGGRRRAQQAVPQLRVAGGVHRAEVSDDRGVDVEAAALRQALGGEHVEAAVGGAPHHRGVERAGAQVVDDEGRADRRTGEPDEHAGRRDRFGHQRHRREPGPFGRRGEDAAPGLRPGRRVRDRRGADRAAGHPLGLDHHPAEHGGDQVDRGDLDVAEEHGRLVDAPLGVRFVPLRAHPGGVRRVAPDQQAGAGVGVDGGRQRGRPVEEERAHLAVRPGQHRDRVRRAEVDAEPVTRCVHSARIRITRSRPIVRVGR